jgi:hypothetical protein
MSTTTTAHDNGSTVLAPRPATATPARWIDDNVRNFAENGLFRSLIGQPNGIAGLDAAGNIVGPIVAAAVTEADLGSYVPDPGELVFVTDAGYEPDPTGAPGVFTGELRQGNAAGAFNVVWPVNSDGLNLDRSVGVRLAAGYGIGAAGSDYLFKLGDPARDNVPGAGLTSWSGTGTAASSRLKSPATRRSRPGTSRWAAAGWWSSRGFAAVGVAGLTDVQGGTVTRTWTDGTTNPIDLARANSFNLTTTGTGTARTIPNPVNGLGNAQTFFFRIVQSATAGTRSPGGHSTSGRRS